MRGEATVSVNRWAERVAVVVWSMGFVAVMTGSAIALVQYVAIDEGWRPTGTTYLVLCLIGVGVALMELGLLLTRHLAR